jgi:hypothetical protein
MAKSQMLSIWSSLGFCWLIALGCTDSTTMSNATGFGGSTSVGGAGSASIGGNSVGGTSATCVPTPTAGAANTSTNLFIEKWPTDTATCLPRAITVQSNCQIPCYLLSTTSSSACTCASQGLAVPSAAIDKSTRLALARDGNCDNDTTPACTAMCVCEVPQSNGADMASCRSDANATVSGPGWCYLSSVTNVAGVLPASSCGQTIRVVGNLPQNSTAYLACTGSAAIW